MTNPAVIPAFLIRQYVYAVLKANEPATWNESNYGGKMPIVPLGEESDLEQYPGPVIVFQFTHSRTGVTWMRGRGSMSFAIRDTNLRRLSRTITIMQEALNRYDESAHDINAYLDSRGAPWNEIGFGYIHTGFVDGGAPAKAEGGELVAVVSIDFDYYTDYTDTINTRP